MIESCPMGAEISQPSWWNKIPIYCEGKTFARSLYQLSPDELESYILFRASTPAEKSKPLIDVIHDETPYFLLMVAAQSDRVLGKKITQATAVLFNKFAIKSKENKTVSADDKRAIRQLSWLVTFGLSELKGNENGLLEMKDSINYLADVYSPYYLNSTNDELDQDAGRALLFAQFELAREGDPYTRWLNIWEEAAAAEGDTKYLKSQWGFVGLAKVAPDIAITKIGELVDRMTSGGLTHSADYKALFHNSSLELLRIFNNDTARLKKILAQINPEYAGRVIAYLKRYKE